MQPTTNNGEILAMAAAIRAEWSPECAALFVAGSLVRGEGTPHSDVDLVVVCQSLNAAYRPAHLDFIRPVTLVDNAFIELFNGRLRNEYLNVQDHVDRRCEDEDRSVAHQ